MNSALGAPPPLVSSLMVVAILIEGGISVTQGRMSVGMLIAFQSLALSFLGPVNNLVALGATVQQLEADLSRLDDVLGRPTRNEPAIESAPDIPVRLRGHVEFRNITFGYSPVDPPLIAGFSLTILPGRRIALVGSSGSASRQSRDCSPALIRRTPAKSFSTASRQLPYRGKSSRTHWRSSIRTWSSSPAASSRT